MPRRRIFYKDSYYHIYGRGIKKEPIFMDFQDKRFYLSRLSRYYAETGNRIIQFCIMPNHYHLLIKTSTAQSASKMMHKLNISYARYYMQKYYHSGHVFQGRFNARYIKSQEYLLTLSRYIHRNPLDSSLVNTILLHEYYWSSYRKFIDNSSRALVKVDLRCIMKYFNSSKEYEEFCLSSDILSKKWLRELVQRPGLI